ncbi:TATA box-binding protein-associated factor RNA polymerase I subunit D [Callithrix jacchus]|uniref:TATA box-binding protein-associated factor RNA polymerase I subunit D n=1 Tax=Callithrix jacchus TaxID=9483 RepID=U3DRE0_CALJA|nr:TATA box-binding protein-associated factor RNA polymerase I subunit D [Callithrix jacchus]XP_054097772.1 TATA box-binding protein-associated factor RNA polymerase I subunit D [Callithrix jacchus]XP_054097773.1 TATA box-binding protein-associated factor RNA polymerase I subunit D [Callithrix jacchus]XP_054097774.1 TATA box-binding protein-associated factor RNA polymerase I subunit D [Callithrix jacchus]
MDKSGIDSLDYVTSDAMEPANQSDNSSDSSLFKTQCVPYSPKQGQRNPIRKCVRTPGNVQASDSSSDSSFEPIPLTMKAIFERFKNRKKKYKKKKKRYQPTGRPRGRPEGRRNPLCSLIDKKKEFRSRGPGFPFLESENEKKAPWKKILTFEQAVARGFFNYIEKLKYEHHLKESLKQMNVGEDLENEDFDSRRYKYLDDEGSISPIEESTAEDEDTTHLEDDECDIKLAGDSFIVSSEFPVRLSVYLEEEDTIEEAALSKKRATKAKNTGQRGLKM